MSAPSTDALRRALRDPETYPHEPASVTLRETHISLVALVPPRVYKVKKAVELGFLDFSTLAQRRHYCEEEVRLNSRLCADTYEGVVPIVETEAGLRVDPSDAVDGTTVEYAVRMRHLSHDQFLHNRVARDEVSRTDVDRVAGALSTFYKTRSSSPEVAAAGWIENLRVSTDENFEQTAGQVGDLLSSPAYDALRYYVDRFYEQNAALLHRRRAGGLVVDGHGDLRLEHVHLTDEALCIYDCIEFNDRLRHLDVANDLAFLAMDFDLHGRPDLGRRLVGRVAEALGDPELDTLIAFYKSYRAYVRGKVEGMQARDEGRAPTDRARSRRRAVRHYRWALRYALAGERPLVVVVFGRSGTGKSTQAAALADATGWAHLSSDRIRKRRAGVPQHRRSTPAERERLYTDRLTDLTYRTLQQRAVERGRAHRGTVLDATYSAPARRDALRTALRAADVPYAFVELTAPDDVLRGRLSDRNATSAHASDARADDFEDLSARYEAPTALESPFHVRVDTEDAPDDTTLAILKALIRLTSDA
jgi:aminoglycoside phosphotransferase family enzyme/predicted kinase